MESIIINRTEEEIVIIKSSTNGGNMTATFRKGSKEYEKYSSMTDEHINEELTKLIKNV